jgi:nitrous oxide reductase accessory protein NosL
MIGSNLKTDKGVYGMLTINRRSVPHVAAWCMVMLLLSANLCDASDRFKVAHPLMPPSKAFSGQCPVCGMLRSMWARTWIEFSATDGVRQVCSFHCLADFSQKSGDVPGNIRLAVYHAPQKMVDSASAIVVVGSSARGTMSPKSKVVFGDARKAKAFVRAHGGEIASFRTALETAQAEVSGENAMLVKRRLKKGKIVEPQAGDRCPVCEMFPARYPRNKCQIHATGGNVHHFCSTQCMFALLESPAKFVKPAFKPKLIWVIDRTSGRWISGRSAYYVVGAKDVLGPMGFEAFAFDKKTEADIFTGKSGGTILLFKDVSVEAIMSAAQRPSQ